MRVIYRDENESGDTVRTGELNLGSATVSLRDLLRARIVADHESFDPAVDDIYRGLVAPLSVEEVGDELVIGTPPNRDLEAEIEYAVAATEAGDLVARVDGVALEDDAAAVTVTEDSTVVFVSFVLLVLTH